MLDIGWPELLVIGAVALVAIGPKDMPKVMHSFGRLVGRARGFMGEMQENFEQLGREADEVYKTKNESDPKDEEDEGDEPPVKSQDIKNDNP